MKDIIAQVKSKIAELQNIMSHKGEGGENRNEKNVVASLDDNVVNAYINSKGGGDIQMNPITRDGQPVVDGKLIDPKAISAMGGGDTIPTTDFLALAKANDPYNDTVIMAKDKENAPETNKVINDELKGMPSATEHSEAEKAVEKAVSTKEASDEIADVVARVKRLKQATEEIGEIVNDKPSREEVLAKIRTRLQQKAKVDGLPTDPVKGSEDAAKTPEESVKSIKTTKAEVKDRPVESMSEGKVRYSPDKDIRDQEAKDALSKGVKDEKVRAKEPNVDRPITNKKAALAGKLASLAVFAEDSSAILKEKPVKYPVEKSPDMDFEGAASRTEKEINKEHSEREKDKGDKSPLKTTLWSQKDKRMTACDRETIKKQIQAYTDELKKTDDIRSLEVLEANISQLEKDMEKLSYVNLSTKPAKDMSWSEIISEGNAVYADLMRILGEAVDIANPFLEDAEKSVKAASLKTAAEEEIEEKDEKEEKGEEKEEKEDKGGKEEKDEKKDDKKDGKKSKNEKSVAKETITLLKDIRDTAEEMTEEIADHLEDVEKKTGIPVPEAKPSMELPLEEGIPGMEGLPKLEGPELGMPGEEELPPMPESGAPAMKMSWLGVMPKTAAEEEQIVEEIKKDATLVPEQKWNEIKKIRKTQGWKAVFTKIGTATEEEKKDEKKKDCKEECKKEASVDKQNSYWSVYRGNELVIRATVEDLYKSKSVEAFDWVSSKGYGEKLLSAVLNDGFVATAEKLGIQSMIKVSAKGKDKVDPKAFYKKVYPASYVSELFKEHKKKAELEINQLKTKLGEAQKENLELKQSNEKLFENQKLHAKAEKALSIVRVALEKGLVDQKDFDATVDGVMVMNDEGFDTFSKTILKAPSVRKASIEEKIDMVKSASKMHRETELKIPIQIQSTNASGMDAMKGQLEGLWAKPAVKI